MEEEKKDTWCKVCCKRRGVLLCLATNALGCVVKLVVKGV